VVTTCVSYSTFVFITHTTFGHPATAAGPLVRRVVGLLARPEGENRRDHDSDQKQEPSVISESFLFMASAMRCHSASRKAIEQHRALGSRLRWRLRECEFYRCSGA
jgi:hypothetical protein